MGLSRVVQVSAGSNFACALDDAGAVFCWGDSGRSDRQQRGWAHRRHRPPIAVPVIRHIRPEGGNVLAVTADSSSVATLGRQHYNLLGLSARWRARATPSSSSSTRPRRRRRLSLSHACLLLFASRHSPPRSSARGATRTSAQGWC
ncbi:MAG: hypothetical protein H6719_35735 [Sandaracinaceae bacterium]|nr:hypothetical protein [Sandaracinaceae bacterium]